MKIIEDFANIATTVTELIKVSGLTIEYEILSNSERHIEHTDSQTWNNHESDGFTIYLKTSIELFSRHESNLDAIEENIKSKFGAILKAYPSCYIEKLVITPRLLNDDRPQINLQSTYEKYAFVSYQVKDKSVAGNIKQLLEGVGIKAFLAHEDIEVSEDWQNKILEEMALSSIFVCLISKNYLSSSWCLQESGMAMLKGITIISLSLDGTVPDGFISRFQATRINPERPKINDLVPGLLKHNKFDGLNIIIELIGAAGSFRDAEAKFQLIMPYVNDLTEIQVKALFQKIRLNGQVHHAGLCANEYIPPLLRKFKDLLSNEDFNYLKDVCEKYQGVV